MIVNGPQEFHSAPLVERARLDAGLVDRLAAVPGVTAAIPDLTVPTTLLRGNDSVGAADGHGWSSAALAPYAIATGHAPAGPRDVVLDSALASRAGVTPGGTIRLSAPAGPAAFRVAGIVTGGPTAVFFTDTEAQSLLGRPGRVDSVALCIRPGVNAETVADRVRATVPGVDALTGDNRGRAELPHAGAGANTLIALSAAFGGVATAIVVFVIPMPVRNATAQPAALLLAAGLALLAPGLSRWLFAVLRRPIAALGGMSGRLAMQNARARRIQLAGAITPIMLATGISTAIIFMNNGQAAATRQLFAADLRADAVITGDVPVALADRIAALPGVAGASALVTSNGFFDAGADDPHRHGPIGQVSLSGITASAAAATTHYAVTAGRLADLTGNTVALAAAYVQPGRQLGDTVRMRLGDNEVVSLRVVAVFDTASGGESALLPAPLLAGHTSFGQADEILVRAAPGVPAATLTSTLTGALADRPGARVADRAAVLSAFVDRQRPMLIVGYLLVTGIIGYTMIALVNTMFAATAKRRREFATQRLVGSTRGQVLRMVGAEAVLVGLAGAVVDLLTVTRFAPSDWGPLWIYPAIVGGAIGLTLVASLASAALVLRGRPILDVAGGE